MRGLLLALLLTFAAAGQVLAQACDATPERHAVRILGTGPDGGLTDLEFPYIAGDRSFYRRLDNGWVFALMRAENGWSIRLYENDNIDQALDLTALTPPLGGVPNPRDIFGWHFRNADNTGPNLGDVNAPQALRAFVIAPTMEAGPDSGIGWLKILDFGLAGLEPGGRARMNYLKFDACLTWPRSDSERDRLLDLASFDFTPEDRETFGACGLDLATYALDARYLPRTLGGDIDGDGALDEVAQVRRIADDKRGLALCRAGTWLHLIGFDHPLGDMAPGYLDQVEEWQWIAPGGERPRYLVGLDLPQGDGGLLVLERVEKEVVILFWRDGALRAERLYHMVEP
ncbi:MAG: hypothetical protein RIC87_04375 [Kiloniellales bacterium]